MKKELLFIAIVCIFSFALFNSCKKEATVTPPLSIAGKWLQTAGTYSPAYFNETDYFSSYSSCEKDDIIEFKTDGSFQYSEGNTKCDAADPQIYQTGNYTVNTTLTSLTVNGHTSVIELADTWLVVTDNFTEGGVTYKDVLTFVRQK